MHLLWIIFLFLLGACVGSFLNVVIYRLPRGESIVFPGSHCPCCGRAIRWHDNIPILSWLLLKGQCRFCRCRISPRYVLVELATACLVAGLYVVYFVLELRTGLGSFQRDWPTFAAHAALLCGLLAASLVDIQLWIIPLEVMWVCAAVGLGASAAGPHPLMPEVSPMAAGMGFMAAVGLGVSLLLMKLGLIQQSFIDAADHPVMSEAQKPAGKQTLRKPLSVAVTTANGVNPRKEVLREMAFLAPPLVLGVGAFVLFAMSPAVQRGWGSLFESARHPVLSGVLKGSGASVLGFLIGGLWVWGMRILGTLAFGKEAMGMGDVHIMSAVGAVTGWVVPSLAFFVAPIFGLAWAAYLWLARGQRELPYGPWLAAATGVVMIFYDAFAEILAAYAQTMQVLWQ